MLYSNECTPRLEHTGNASWANITVPAALDLISVDIYASYTPGSSGAEEVAAVREQYEHGLLPRLGPAQQAMLVPGGAVIDAPPCTFPCWFSIESI